MVRIKFRVGKRKFTVKNNNTILMLISNNTQLSLICSKSTIETLEKGVKQVQS